MAAPRSPAPHSSCILLLLLCSFFKSLCQTLEGTTTETINIATLNVFSAAGTVLSILQILLNLGDTATN